MNQHAIAQMSDADLTALLRRVETEIAERAERRRKEAMEQIRQIAAQAKIAVSFVAGRGRSKPTLKAGDCYRHPTEPGKQYVVGKGRPPEWFEELKRKGRLPLPSSTETA